MTTRGALALLLLAAACGSDPANDGPADAGVDARPPIPPPVAPAPPAPAVLGPCPAGWTEVPPEDEGGMAVCEPWPGGAPAECAADEAHFPGEPGCARLGTACPAGEWPEELPAGASVLYVRAGGAPGGDGTQAAPFGTIAEALAAAAPGTVVALGKGTFAERVTLAGVTLWGACVAETILAPAEAISTGGVVTIAGAGAAVRNLQITGEGPGIWLNGAGRSVDVEGVLVVGARFLGVAVLRGSATGRAVAIRDTRGRVSDGRFGRGLEVENGGIVELERSVLERNHDFGAWVGGEGAILRLDDVAIRDTRTRASDGWFGRGVGVEDFGTAELTRVVLERNHDRGLLASDGTTVRMDQCVVRDHLPDVTGESGLGLSAIDGAVVEVDRTLFERNRAFEVWAGYPGTTVALRDVVARDTLPQESTQEYGRALNVLLGAQVTVERALFERLLGAAVLAAEPGTTLAMTDLALRDIDVQAADSRYGWAVAVQYGATVTITRARVERTIQLALFANDASRLVLEDLVVTDIASDFLTGVGGIGLIGNGGARLELRRARFERNREASIVMAFGGTQLLAEDLDVRDTLERACATTSCPGAGGGAAIVVHAEAHVDVRRFVLSRNALTGVSIAGLGTMDLHQGVVSENPIGANVADDGFDLTRLSDQVEYRDNGRNLDSSSLPLPDAVVPVP